MFFSALLAALLKSIYEVAPCVCACDLLQFRNLSISDMKFDNSTSAADRLAGSQRLRRHQQQKLTCEPPFWCEEVA